MKITALRKGRRWRVDLHDLMHVTGYGATLQEAMADAHTRLERQRHLAGWRPTH